MLPTDTLEIRLARLAQSPLLHAQVFAHVVYGPVQYPLWAFSWGDPSLPAVLIFAGVHGDEPGAIEATLRLLEALSGGATPFIRYRLQIFPCLNPSGYADGTRSNRIGQDINRQFHADNTQETAALRRFLDPHTAAVLIDLHTDPHTQGYYFFELCRHQAPELAEYVRKALNEASFPLEERPFYAGYWGWRGVFAPSPTEMEAYQRTVIGQSLGEWGWFHEIPRCYSMEAPFSEAFEHSAAMHITALFALFAALESEPTTTLKEA